MTEELAIIKDIHIGMRDWNEPICWFTVHAKVYSSLQIISLEEIGKIIKKHSIYKLEDLEGKPCIIECEKNIMTFKDLKKI